MARVQGDGLAWKKHVPESGIAFRQRTFHMNGTVAPSEVPPSPWNVSFSTNFTIPAGAPITPQEAFIADRPGRLLSVEVMQVNDALPTPLSVLLAVSLTRLSPPFVGVAPLALVAVASVGPLLVLSGVPILFDFSPVAAAVFATGDAVGVSVSGLVGPIASVSVNIHATCTWSFGP